MGIEAGSGGLYSAQSGYVKMIIELCGRRSDDI